MVTIIALFVLLFIIVFLLSGVFTTSYYDIVVIGGDPEGVVASVAAARIGAKVLQKKEEV